MLQLNEYQSVEAYLYVGDTCGILREVFDEIAVPQDVIGKILILAAPSTENGNHNSLIITYDDYPLCMDVLETNRLELNF